MQRACRLLQRHNGAGSSRVTIALKPAAFVQQQQRRPISYAAATAAPSSVQHHSGSSAAPTRVTGLRMWPLSLSQHSAPPAAAPASAAMSSSTARVSPSSASASSSASSMSSRRSFSSVIQQQISEYARQPQKGLTLHQLLEVGVSPSPEQLLNSARFLHRELPIRLAKRVKELESLPYGLSQMKPVIKVKEWYEESFRELLSFPDPRTTADEIAFTALLEKIYERHTDVVPTLAKGVVQMKSELGSSGEDVMNNCPFLQDFLNRFHSSRIGIRLLISQHLAIHHPVPGYIGVVATSISPVGVIRDAIEDARRICDREYGHAPEVDLIECAPLSNVNFVPSHLHHIIFELIKNSMRAVLEFHGVRNYDAPAIQVVLSDDEREFAIKISDQGGGIPRKDMHRIWSYLYTTTTNKSTQQLLDSIGSGGANTQGSDAAGGHPTNAVGPQGGSEGTPMSGFGYGLPISRLYASYFGGDLNVVSVEGYGTDAYLYLNKLGDFNLFLE